MRVAASVSHDVAVDSRQLWSPNYSHVYEDRGDVPRESSGFRRNTIPQRRQVAEWPSSVTADIAFRRSCLRPSVGEGKSKSGNFRRKMMPSSSSLLLSPPTPTPPSSSTPTRRGGRGVGGH